MVKGRNEFSSSRGGRPLDLIGQAEERAERWDPKTSETLTPQESSRLIHELRVRAIELQMQNEELRQDLEELREAAELHRLLTEHAVLGVAVHEIVLDASGRPVDYVFVSVNPAFETHTGLKAADVLGRRVTEVLPGIEKTPFIETYGRVVLSGEPVCFEQYSEPLDRHFLVAAHSIAEGRFATVFTDITERKRAEEARLASEKKRIASEALLAQVQQIAHIGSWTMDLTLNRLIWSDETYRIFGYQPQEFVASTEAFFDSVHPDDRPAVQEAYASSLREGGASYEIVHRIIRQDNGEIRFVHERCQHERDASGAIVRSIGMAHDITEQVLARQELEEEGQRLREAQEIAHVGSWNYDAIRNRLTWSDETHRIFGTKRGTFEETYGAFLDTVHPEDRSEVEALYARSLEDAEVAYEIEHRVIRRDDGQERLVYEKCRHQRDGDGRVLRSMGVVHDITKIRKTEAKYQRTAELLRATGMRFQAILDHSPLLICEFDLDGRYLLVNPAVSALFDLPASQLVGKTFDELLPDETVRRLKDRIEEVQAVGAPIRVEDTVETVRGATHFLSTLFPLPDEAGDVRSIGCIAYDITTLKATTDALRESEEKHRLLFETMAQGVIYQNASDGAIVSANPASERILGITLEQMQGKTSMDPRWQMIDQDGAAVSGADHPTMICLRTGVPIGPVVRGVFRPDKNAYLWLSITSIPLFRPGDRQPFQAYAVFEDITERQQTAEELRQLNLELEERVHQRTLELADANHQLEAFSHSVSHDLRAPLRGVSGLSQILLDKHATELTEDGRNLCVMIREGAESMRRMIESLLEFARTGRVDLRARPIDVAALVQEVIGELRTDRNATGVDFRVGDLPACHGDYNLIRQVWRNLLTNAVKYSSIREQPVIELGATREGGAVVYQVQDNGVGFDMQFVDKLFQVFQRMHSSKDFEGAGVGLAIVQQIVRRHGGRVWAHGEPDEGATFSFTLGEHQPSATEEVAK